MSIARMLQDEGWREKGASLSGIGGVETGGDAAEFILLGSDTVQVRAGAARLVAEHVARLLAWLAQPACLHACNLGRRQPCAPAASASPLARLESITWRPRRAALAACTRCARA